MHSIALKTGHKNPHFIPAIGLPAIINHCQNSTILNYSRQMGFELSLIVELGSSHVPSSAFASSRSVMSCPTTSQSCNKAIHKRTLQTSLISPDREASDPSESLYSLKSSIRLGQVCYYQSVHPRFPRLVRGRYKAFLLRTLAEYMCCFWGYVSTPCCRANSCDPEIANPACLASNIGDKSSRSSPYLRLVVYRLTAYSRMVTFRYCFFGREALLPAEGYLLPPHFLSIC